MTKMEEKWVVSQPYSSKFKLLFVNLAICLYFCAIKLYSRKELTSVAIILSKMFIFVIFESKSILIQYGRV